MSKFHEKYEKLYTYNLINQKLYMFVRRKRKFFLFSVNNRNRKKLESQIIIIIRGEKLSGIKIKEISDDAFRKWSCS